MKEKIAIIGILANVILAGGKISVGLVSNSAAVLAAGLDSFADIFSSFVSFAGIKISSKPADDRHPYGHYKFEVLSGVIITIMIFLTGAGIIYDAYSNFQAPAEVEIGYLAFGMMVFSVLVNEVMSRLKIYFGKKENSVSLLSDGFHSRLDVYTSLAVLGGLLLTNIWIYADSIAALLMGLYIVKEAFSIGKEAISSLLDVSAGKEIEQQIKTIADQQKIVLDNLKTQKKGAVITANLEIKLPSDLKIEEATKLSNDLRSQLIQEVEGLKYVAIQISSHQLENSFYQPAFGRGFGWQRKSGLAKNRKEDEAPEESSYCICEKCGYRIPHQKGRPCASYKCPLCQSNLQREIIDN